MEWACWQNDSLADGQGRFNVLMHAGISHCTTPNKTQDGAL